MAVANSEAVLWVVDAKQRYAVPAKVHYGAPAGPFIIVRDGIKPGDQVIVADMAQFGDDTPKIKLVDRLN